MNTTARNSITRVHIEYVQRLVERALRAGCEKEEILQLLEIDDRFLTEQQEVSALRYGEMYQRVMRFTQDEWFGIFAEGKVPLGAFRLMCLTLLGCADLRQAIIRGGEFAEICRGLSVRYLLELEDGIATLSLKPCRSLSQAQFDDRVKNAAPDSIFASMFMWHRLQEWLIGMEIPVHKVTVTFPKEQEKVPFDFPKITHFEYGAAQNSMAYDAKYLDHPIVQNEGTLMDFLRSAPYHLVTEDPSHISTADKVRNILKKDVSGHMPSAEAVASQLNVSVTTLRRQLQKDETSYQQIKDECRMEAAFHYLNCMDISNSAIAEMLGFDEPSAFFRSFKKWTGQTPGEYRASLGTNKPGKPV